MPVGAAGAGVGAGAEIGGGVTFSTFGLGCCAIGLGVSFFGAGDSTSFLSREAGAATTGVTGTGFGATAVTLPGTSGVAGNEPAIGTELTGTAGAVTGLTSDVSSFAGARL